MGPDPATVLREAEAACRAAGHDNAGPLSARHGFVPARPPLTALPPDFAAWDEAAAELPALYAELGLRRRLEALPLLDAGALPEDALQRAATVLGVLVHAYHRVQPRLTGPTPEALDRPWRQVSARLGRDGPLLSYLDLVVANWRPADPAAAREIRVATTRLLVPTVGTEEEQRFYLTQLEMLDRGTPLVAAAARAAAAAAAGDPDALAGELHVMAECVTSLTLRGLPRIDPRPGSRFHVDPVVWAKTVAPLAVPLVPGTLGPSGTASPMFMVLDAVSGRATRSTAIGAEGRRLLHAHPPHWRAFVAAAEAADVPGRAAALGHPPLDAALAALRSAYAGRGGLLQRHRRKAIGYLDTAFRVGRDVTIADFTAYTRVSRALADSRDERAGADPAGADLPFAAPDREMHASELLRHHRGAETVWVALSGVVADVTGFLRRHPGGVAPLAAVTGTDATAAYAEVGHGDDPAVAALVARHAIGRVAPTPVPAPRRAVYDAWLACAVTATRRANVLDTDLTIRSGRTSSATGPGELTPYTVQFAIEVHERFAERAVPELRAALAELAAASPGAGLPAPDTVTAGPPAAGLYTALERASAPDELTAVDAACRAACAADAALLHGLRDRFVLGVERLEAGGEP